MPEYSDDLLRVMHAPRYGLANEALNTLMEKVHAEHGFGNACVWQWRADLNTIHCVHGVGILINMAVYGLGLHRN